MLRRILILTVAVGCSLGLANFATAEDVRSLLKAGESLTSLEVEALEAQLEDDPLDMSIRTRLLGYHGDRTRYREPSSRARIVSLLLWLIQNEPKSEIIGTRPMGIWGLDPSRNPEAYVEAKRAFLAHLEKAPNDLTLLGYTTDLLATRDRPLSVELLERAKSLDSSNLRVAQKLALLYYFQGRGGLNEPNVEAARKAVAEYDRILELDAETSSKRYLRHASEAALLANDFEKAGEYAHLMLGEARPGSYSYGDQFHFGNITLGKVALAQGDIQGAASYLLLAGSAPGSTQLNYLGPDTELAKQLLEKGEQESVLRYLDQCASFWERGQDKLREWAILVRAGQVPSFRRY